MTTRPTMPTTLPNRDATFHLLADELEALRSRPFDVDFYGDAARLARRVRAALAADALPARERFRQVIDDAPRLDARLRALDDRRQRIARNVDLVLATTEGTLRSAEVTRLTLYRLTIEVAALAHLRHDLVLDSVTTDIGGTG